MKRNEAKEGPALQVSIGVDTCRARQNVRDSLQRSQGQPPVQFECDQAKGRLDSRVKKALTRGERSVETSEASSSRLQPSGLNFPVFSHLARFPALTQLWQVKCSLLSQRGKGRGSPPFLSLRVAGAVFRKTSESRSLELESFSALGG
jgi:hypothetical protein